MIIFVFLFFMLGLLAIFVEMLTPHGISAVIGLGLVIFSCYLAVRLYGATLGTLYCFMAMGVALLVTRFVIVSGFQWMNLKPARKPKDPDVARELAKAQKSPQVGETARVIQPLRPTGTVEWEGLRLPARTIYPDREIPIGATVRVRGKDSVYYLVEGEAAGSAQAPSSAAS